MDRNNNEKKNGLLGHMVYRTHNIREISEEESCVRHKDICKTIK